MSKFIAIITRVAPQTLEVEIEASTVSEAISKANDMAGNLDFSGKEKESEYEVAITMPVQAPGMS